MRRDERTPQATFSPARLEALADGVFAIAITLLILEIRLPGETEAMGLGIALAILFLLPHRPPSAA